MPCRPPRLHRCSSGLLTLRALLASANALLLSPYPAVFVFSSPCALPACRCPAPPPCPHPISSGLPPSAVLLLQVLISPELALVPMKEVDSQLASKFEVGKGKHA